MAAKKKKKEGAVAKTLRTWSPGKYIGKFIKGESIGVSEKTAKQRAKKAAEKKASSKAETSKRVKKHKESVKKKDKGTGAKDWYPGKYAKKFIKGEDIAVPKSKKKADAKKKEGKTWTKAVKAQKKAGGESLSSLVSKRKGLTKGSAEYASVQNKINKAYGVKKRHTTTAESRSKAKPFSPGSKEDVGGKQKEAQLKKEGTFAQGGKVESNPYGWPSRDARNGGKK